jgi:hypothetical protein
MGTRRKTMTKYPPLTGYKTRIKIMEDLNISRYEFQKFKKYTKLKSVSVGYYRDPDYEKAKTKFDEWKKVGLAKKYKPRSVIP